MRPFMIHTVRAPKIGAKKAKHYPKSLSTNSGENRKTKNYQRFPVHKFMDTRNLVDLATANNPISKQKA